MKKTFLFLPFLALIACGPSASEIDAKVKAALKNQQDSIAAAEKAKADSVASVEAAIAQAQQSQENNVESNELEWNYSGTIDKYPIKMFLKYEEADGGDNPISGYYYYDNQQTKIPLKGGWEKNGIISLVAETKGGNENFDGQFTESMLEDFSGTWEKNGKQLKFSLNSKK